MVGRSYNHNCGYGEYFPLTLAGRLIALAVMFSGTGIVVVIVGIISQKRIEFRVKIKVENRSSAKIVR